MWQKVAKFKGAEYFRKALYMQSVELDCMYLCSGFPQGNPLHSPVEGVCLSDGPVQSACCPVADQLE